MRTTFPIEETQCNICFEQFHEKNRKPQVLTNGEGCVCKHFLCRECARDILNGNNRRCPFCRAPFTSFRDAHGIHEMSFSDLERFFGSETEWHPYQIAVLLKTRHFPRMPDAEFVVIFNDLLSKIEQPKELAYISKERLQTQWYTIMRELATEIAKRDNV